ncbi:MAG: glycosyltransferase [Pseudomonadota bacterium]
MAMRAPRVAFVHYWMLKMRGGEKVLEELLKIWPSADIYTHVVDREALSPVFSNVRITETFVGSLPRAKRHYQKYLPFMPRALEELDLSAYDLVISSESGPAKGVIARPDALHVCYCHSPMRYLWDQYPYYRDRFPRPLRPVVSFMFHRLRQWDVASAARVDAFAANSWFVAKRLGRAWGRDATVIHPPVDLSDLGDGPVAGPGERSDYLFVSELVGYKRADLAIEAFRAMPDRRLLIVGDGEERGRLMRDLPPNVTMLGRVSRERLLELFGSVRALVFPGEEDFGIVPVEAMGIGCPVIAFRRGGATETVKADETGVFFDDQEPGALVAAVQRFEGMAERFAADRLQARAQEFSPERFRESFSRFVEDSWQRKLARRPADSVPAADLSMTGAP